MNINQRVYKVVSQIMGVPIEDINDDSSPDTLENWDSLNYMNLVMALEQEFGIQFNDQAIVEMLNVGLIGMEVQDLLNMSKK